MIFVRVHGSTEEIHCEEGHKWLKAVSTYFDRLCLDECKSKSGSSVVSEEAAANLVGTSESCECESGIGDSDFNEFFAAGFLPLVIVLFGR